MLLRKSPVIVNGKMRATLARARGADSQRRAQVVCCVADMPTRTSSLGAVVVGALIACSGGGGASAVDAVTIDTPVVAPDPVTFRLSYQSDVPDSIYVQSGTEAGGQGWLSVRPAGGGPALVILDDCGRCDCAR